MSKYIIDECELRDFIRDSLILEAVSNVFGYDSDAITQEDIYDINEEVDSIIRRTERYIEVDDV